MNPLRTIWSRLRSLWQRREVEREIDEELRFHLEQRTAEYIANGMSPEEAAREARKRFGNLQSVREDCREKRGASFGEATWQDIRFGLRMLRKSPGFTTVAVLTLALGIGANLAMFSVLRPLLLQRLPYPDYEQLVRIYRTSPQSQTWSHSRADFSDYREQSQVFNELAACTWGGFNYGLPGQPAERLTAVLTTAELFPALRIQPMLGRAFTRAEMQPGRPQVVVLSHAFWLSHAGGDTNIVGRTLRFDGKPVTVIGVMPASFDSPHLFGRVHAWRPLVMTTEEARDRENRFLEIIGRLKPGASLAQARADLNRVAVRLAAEHPHYDAGCGARLVTLTDSLTGENQRESIWFLFGLTSFVLLIACANLANLQLARNASRFSELGLRAALGASQGRLMRQLLTESLLISLLGTGLGLLFARWGVALLFSRFSLGVSIAFDKSVFVCSLACCLVTVVAFGTAPAWLAVRANLIERLRESVRGALGSRAHHRLQCGLIVGEGALALMLLVGAGATVTLLQRFVRLDPGWDANGLLTVQVEVTKDAYPIERRLALFGQLEERLTALPGVQSAAFVTDLPIVAYWNTQPLRVGDQPAPPRNAIPLASCPTVGCAYFQTLGIGLRQGRVFTPEDKLGHLPVTIINETLARQFWPGQDPLGKRVSIGDPTVPRWMEIVGVVGDVKFPADMDKPATRLQVYRPWAQDDISTGGTVVLRTVAPPATIVPAVRQAVAELDPNLPVYAVSTVRQRIDGAMRGTQLVTSLLAVFGMLGLVLAAVGVYGVTAFVTALRTREMGIRMALGARRCDILWLVLRHGLRLVSWGTLLGAAGAYVVMRVLDSMIPEGSPARDPVRLAGVPIFGWILISGAAALLFVVALLSTWLPARRAAGMHPMVALRCE